jgi:dTDP-4-amino-4,6-dideoxygalactose transaminase
MNRKAEILGGPISVTHDHEPVCRWPHFDAQDEQAILAVLRDGNVSTHPVIRELEQAYAARFKRRHAVAHCNGTAALHAAFFALNLQPGDEILVPSATFWASVLPMCWHGLVPVFCESEPQRLGIDPADMERRITPRTRAVVVVHLWGMPSKMSEIRAVAARHGLKIIEDASHTHGASWRDIPCGALGDISVFSLQGDKLAPGGEGGVLLCDDDACHERVLCLGDITRIIGLPGAARRFAATSFGIKTRIAPLSAALGRSQLAKLDEHNAQRNANHQRLSLALEALNFETFLPPPHIRRVYFEYIIRPRDPTLPMELLIEGLQAEGCRVTQPRYPLLHQQPFFTEGHWRAVARLGEVHEVTDYRQLSLPATEAASQTLLRLPVFPNADNGLIDDYIEAFTKVIENREAIANRS